MKSEEYLKRMTIIRKGSLMASIKPRIYCADGFHFSLQTHNGAYCSPRDDGGWYYEAEIGYPSQQEDLIMEYCENETNPTDTVYAYVPLEVVDAVIEKHGGIDFAQMLEMYFKKYQQ